MGIAITLTILSVIGVGSATLTFVALGLGEPTQAKVLGVIAGLSVSAIQVLLLWQGVQIFKIWMKRMDTWASEWALIQQEIGRRREFGS